ncbi:hypothetical protein XENOCAPTIV_019196 [Xenoophorus captivus]|uniref:C-type lectin domain-containing protein n=1 Tax=Xenoophorus captivus TaxID=1517983 RepID=A0ABV0S0B4_9TELE
MSKELIRLQSLSKQKKTCSAGWSMFSCSCYYLSTSSGSWDEGREDCRNRGGDLLVIDGADEQVMWSTGKFISTFTKQQAWIGLNDKETEGSWKWVDGTSMMMPNWEKDQPDNGGGDAKWGEEDCVHVRTDGKASWNDRLCTVSLFWICEKVPTLS